MISIRLIHSLLSLRVNGYLLLSRSSLGWVSLLFFNIIFFVYVIHNYETYICGLLSLCWEVGGSGMCELVYGLVCGRSVDSSVYHR